MLPDAGRNGMVAHFSLPHVRVKPTQHELFTAEQGIFRVCNAEQQTTTQLSGLTYVMHNAANGYEYVKWRKNGCSCGCWAHSNQCICYSGCVISAV